MPAPLSFFLPCCLRRSWLGSFCSRMSRFRFSLWDPFLPCFVRVSLPVRSSFLAVTRMLLALQHGFDHPAALFTLGFFLCFRCGHGVLRSRHVPSGLWNLVDFDTRFSLVDRCLVRSPVFPIFLLSFLMIPLDVTSGFELVSVERCIPLRTDR